MKRMAITVLVFAGLTAATAAMAVDLHPRSGSLPQRRSTNSQLSVQSVYGCDDNFANSAWYEYTDDRVGNVFNFGSGAVLSRVGFWHYGYGNPGPYNYDVELWDPTSCTYIAARNNLVAADAADALTWDEVDLCPDALFVTGNVAVLVDPNTCVTATDCYPDIVFDDQLDVVCPMIINDASTSPICWDYSPYSGPFLLRVETDNCPTPARQKSWGQVKSIYR